MLIHAQNMHISLLLLEVNEEISKLTTDLYCQPVAAGSSPHLFIPSTLKGLMRRTTHFGSRKLGVH